MGPRGKDSHKKMLLFSQSEETTNSKPVSIESMDGETVKGGVGVGVGEGRGRGQKNMGRIVRPETSTHYTDDGTDAKLVGIRPSEVVAKAGRIDKPKLEAERREGQEDRL
jgi:hypothetical protein